MRCRLEQAGEAGADRPPEPGEGAGECLGAQLPTAGHGPVDLGLGEGVGSLDHRSCLRVRISAGPSFIIAACIYNKTKNDMIFADKAKTAAQ